MRCLIVFLQDKLFNLLANRAVTTFAPGETGSSIRVYSRAEFSSLKPDEVSRVFSRQSILVRGGEPDSFWSWGLEAFSVLRPIHDTVVQVQGALTFCNVI